jgi:hypothetical protein
MASELTKEMFEYLAELGRMNVKQRSAPSSHHRPEGGMINTPKPSGKPGEDQFPRGLSHLKAIQTPSERQGPCYPSRTLTPFSFPKSPLSGS